MLNGRGSGRGYSSSNTRDLSDFFDFKISDLVHNLVELLKYYQSQNYTITDCIYPLILKKNLEENQRLPPAFIKVDALVWEVGVSLPR